jgi:pyruvate formate lyase activating enzyme
LKCLIKGFLENTLIDWPGKLCSIVFLPGCNFRCPYCHAKHLVHSDPLDESIPVGAVTQKLEELKGWLDGVVVSGGEPTLHDELEGLLEEFRKTGALTKLDTNGSDPEMIGHLVDRGLVDCVAMDVKAPLDDRYLAVTGGRADLACIRRSIKVIMDAGVEYEFRTTMCPAFVRVEDVVEIARSVSGARRLALQQFRPTDCLDESLEKVTPYDREVLERAARLAAEFVAECVVV